MSQRERTLTLLVGGAIAVLLNVFLISFFLGKYRESSDAMIKAESKLRSLHQRESERDLWGKRDVWLTSNLEPFTDKETVNKYRKEALQELAKKNEVLIETFTPGIPLPQPAYISFGVKLECKGKWEQMSHFLRELQSQPERFIVIESLDLKVDPSDKTQLRAVMMVSKWFSKT